MNPAEFLIFPGSNPANTLEYGGEYTRVCIPGHRVPATEPPRQIQKNTSILQLPTDSTGCWRKDGTGAGNMTGTSAIVSVTPSPTLISTWRKWHVMPLPKR